MKLTYQDIKHLYRKDGNVNSTLITKSVDFKNSQLYQDIINQTNFLPNDVSLSERLYCIKEDINELILCEVCRINNVLYNKSARYLKYCKVCSSLYINIKTKNTKLIKYGDENYNNREKATKTCLKKYGVNHQSQTKRFKEKSKTTNLERYGVEYVYQSNEFKQKSIKTCLEKYGVENPFQIKEIKEKIKQTCLEKYGTSHYTQSAEYLLKSKNTNLIKFGSTSHFNAHISKENFEKYNDEQWLREQIEILNRSTKDIAEELGILSVANIVKKCKLFNIDLKRSIGFSHSCVTWLEYIMEQENIYIQHAKNEGEYKIQGTRYFADGYHKESNTVFEFYGDIWHGNLEIYQPQDKPHPFNEITALELFEKTIEREEIIKSLGYNVVSIWENSWKNLM